MSITLAPVTGIMLVIASFLRLGVLAYFLSRPVLDGFVVDVAISIVVSQLDNILGCKPQATYDFVPKQWLLPIPHLRFFCLMAKA